MKIHAAAILLLAASFVPAALAQTATAVIGQPAPAFTAPDTNGNIRRLDEFKGKYVVLEWVNPGCPFVRKHYRSGNMQATQKEAIAAGHVWLSVNSSGPSSSDYRTPGDMAAWMKKEKATVTATLLDSEGSVGKAYGAKTTPHMYVIDPAGTLIYSGGIDNMATARVEDIPLATNYIKLAFSEIKAGKPLSHASTSSYGCSVKYAN